MMQHSSASGSKAMFATTLQRLVDKKQASVREIAEVCGRGESTVYRWLNRQSEPSFDDVRLLVRHLSNQEARALLISAFTAGLPVAVHWSENGESEAGEALSENGHDALGAALLAMECLTETLSEEYAIERGEGVREQQVVEVTHMIDKAVNYLTASKERLERRLPRRQQARRPSEGASRGRASSQGHVDLGNMGEGRG